MEKRIEIFCCYARRDQSYLLELKVHLVPLERAGLITLWADIDIDAGTEWEKEIHRHLNTAHIILLLISPDFMASEYCYSVEMRKAIERHKHGNAHVIPVILRPTYWYEAPFGKLQVLPTFAKPIISDKWRYPDEAFLDVVTGIRKIVEKLRLGPPRITEIRERIEGYIPLEMASPKSTPDDQDTNASGTRWSQPSVDLSAEVQRETTPERIEQNLMTTLEELEQSLRSKGFIPLAPNSEEYFGPTWLVSLASQTQEGSISSHDPEASQALTAEPKMKDMKTRLVSISNMAPRLYRAAHAVALKQGKEVEFLLEGQTTEVDRAVFEEISGLLLHLVHNAVNHAIEKPQIRIQKGKPPIGQVVLSASYEGNEIVITLRDDGTGLDREGIRQRAVARGLIRPDQQLTEHDIVALIFHPGFSTVEVLSEESGRGVGLDVVRDSVSRLRGTLIVESTPNKGTAFIMKFPTSVAI